MKKFKELRESYLEEKLKASDPAGMYIHDFVHSDNPKFTGKSKTKRIQMALAASYGAKGKSRNEEIEIDEASNPAQQAAIAIAIKKAGKKPKNEEIEEVGEEAQLMSRAAKGMMKYGKEGMQALAKAGKEGRDLDKVRDKYNKYDEAVMDTVKSVVKTLGKALTGGSDADQLKNLQKKMGMHKMPNGKMMKNSAMKEDSEILDEDKPGLYANIQAKRRRIAAGSGEHMRKPGSKGAPTASAFTDSAKTAKK